MVNFSLDAVKLDKPQTGCIVIPVFDNGHFTASGKTLNQAAKHYISDAIKHSGFQGKLGQTLPLYHPSTQTAEHILVVGAGKSGDLSPNQFKKITLAAIKALSTTAHKKAILCTTDLAVGDEDLSWKIKQTALYIQEALYRFDEYKSTKEPAPALTNITLQLDSATHKKSAEKALVQAEAIGLGMTYCKNLANTPSNICTPAYLANAAKQLPKTYKSISVDVLNKKAMEKLGMGALLGVAQGSAQEPFLICLEYHGAAKSKAPIALVGKGITFDTGGNSLKPADSMVGMKYDMCGAATVLGTIKAAAELKLPINIVGVIAAVENMPGGTAYKPEDILTSLSGQTIEVLNTDAEGRLVLADALTYCERFKPSAVIDIATLTGAVVIALGTHTTGLLGNHQPLVNDLLKAGEKSNDPAWQLPITDDYQEQIKSPFADMANTGGRSAGTITAACFLSRFAKKFHWAHLDVAGTAAMMMGGADRYATGRPVPLLMQYLINRSSH